MQNGSRSREVKRQSDCRGNPLRLQAPCSHFQPSHIGAAGSQAATAFCTTASTTLRGGHLALTVGFVQMNTTPKESQGVGRGPLTASVGLLGSREKAKMTC